MSRPPSTIPEPPRTAKWKSCLARRWVLGLVGGILALLGLLVLAIFLLSETGGSPFRDTILDSGAATARGEITEVARTGVNWFGPVWRVDYQFRTSDGVLRTGASFTDDRTGMHPGAEATIEFSPVDPAIHRVKDTFLVFFGQMGTWLLTLLIGPGIILLFLWFRGALTLRLMLRDGRQTSAEILARAPTRHVNPPQVRLDYEFRDAVGRDHRACQWVAQSSPLGQMLVGQRPAVIHDQAVPASSRLVTAGDFTEDPGGRSA